MPAVRRILETAFYCDDLARTTLFYERLLDGKPMLHERFHSDGPSAFASRLRRGRLLAALKPRSDEGGRHRGTEAKPNIFLRVSVSPWHVE